MSIQNLSGDSFDLVQRYFNLDTVLRILANKHVISKAEFERLRSKRSQSSCTSELRSIVVKNGVMKDFFTTIKELVFDVNHALAEAMIKVELSR